MKESSLQLKRNNTAKTIITQRGEVVGKIFNSWKVLEYESLPSVMLVCLCIKCNETKKIISFYDLQSGRTRCCRSCTPKSNSISRREENNRLVGKKYGFWLVEEIKKDCASEALCLCTGCNNTRRYVSLQRLKSGISKSCSCQRKQMEQNTNRNNGFYKLTTKGKKLKDICKLYEVPETNAYKIYKLQGEEAFYEYVRNHSESISSLEQHFLRIHKDYFPNLSFYNKTPLEFTSRKRPDFRIEKDNKILYVNTDGLFDHIVGGRRNLSKDYHLSLRQDFSAHNQTIFQFRGDELRDKPNIVRSIVLNYFNIYKNTYYARKCLIKQVSTKEADLFYSQNHLMGKYSSAKHFGLYYNDTLVAMMSTKLNKKDNSLEIARYCNLLETKVPGGFSKLLKYTESLFKPSKVVSFCDLRYALGHTYTKLGFTLEKTTLGWNWTDFQNTYNRLKCRANMDDRKLTQAEHAKELKLSKIYDAGQAKYVKGLNKKNEEEI